MVDLSHHLALDSKEQRNEQKDAPQSLEHRPWYGLFQTLPAVCEDVSLSVFIPLAELSLFSLDISVLPRPPNS